MKKQLLVGCVFICLFGYSASSQTNKNLNKKKGTFTISTFNAKQEDTTQCYLVIQGNDLSSAAKGRKKCTPSGKMKIRINKNVYDSDSTGLLKIFLMPGNYSFQMFSLDKRFYSIKTETVKLLDNAGYYINFYLIPRQQ